MESTHRTRLSVVALAGLALVVAGCGGGSDYKNEPRPPSPINVTAAVSANRVSVSPASFGAGPIVVIVTNQSTASQEVTFTSESAGTTGPGDVNQSTAPINPGDTGEIKLDVAQGNYVVRTGDEAVRPATVTVGPKRQSAQNQLLQP
ncbi:MAG: hypothetical protein QOE65_2088 [Solirubrobacteraceae bacterium]|jgi:ABC-type glycerol-3-phosphate transport system substrate-binding protein|nr:hypothetical protein [Solirubrobacteraceae bacterium]